MTPVKVPQVLPTSLFRDQTIEEFTTCEPVCVSPETKVDEVIALFKKHRFRHLPVVKDGKAVGVISDRDILIARPMGVSGVIRAGEVMTRDPYSVRINASLEEVALELSKRKFGSAMVYDLDEKFYGIFTATDALNALVELLREGRF